MNDRDARAVVELHALLCQREGAGDEGLRCHDGGERRNHDERIQEGTRRQEVERVLDGVGDAEHQRALPEIVEEERGEDDHEPDEANGGAAEVPHVRVQRFRPGHGKHNRAEHQKARSAVIEEEPSTVPWVQRTQNRWLANDLEGAQRRDCREPYEHDRTEDAAHPRGPVLLEEEQQEEDEKRGGQYVGSECRRGDLETLSGAEHGDGRGDDTVAVEQGGAEKSQRDDEAATALLSQQGEQRHDTALAVIVQTLNETEVLEDLDTDYRPADEQESAG